MALESLDLVYEEIKGRFDYQDAQIAALNTKANFNLASSSLLIAALTGLAKTIGDAQKVSAGEAPKTAVVDLWYLGDFKATSVAEVLTIVAVVIYLFVVGFSFLAYRLQGWKVVPNPTAILKLLDNDPQDTKQRLVKRRVEALVANELELNKKTRWVRFAMYALVIQAGMLLLLGIVSVRIA